MSSQGFSDRASSATDSDLFTPLCQQHFLMQPMPKFLPSFIFIKVIHIQIWHPGPQSVLNKVRTFIVLAQHVHCNVPLLMHNIRHILTKLVYIWSEIWQNFLICLCFVFWINQSNTDQNFKKVTRSHISSLKQCNLS